MELKTAKAWGLTPDQWDNESDASKAQMLGYEDVSATMAAYDDQVHEDKMESERSKGRGR